MNVSRQKYKERENILRNEKCQYSILSFSTMKYIKERKEFHKCSPS